MQAERTLTSRKLLDLEPHVLKNGSYDFESLSRDVAAAAIEVDRTKPTEQRVWRVRLYLTGEDQVLNWPNKTKDAREQYSVKNEFDKKETDAGIGIIDFLKTGEVGEMFTWISPPTEEFKYYDQARLQVGIIREKMGFKFIEYYGIPLKMNAENCIKLFYWLQEFSGGEAKQPKDSEELRGVIIDKIKASENQEWIDFWNEVVPELSSVWETIKSGQVGENTRNVLADARKSVRSVAVEIKRSIRNQDYPNLIYSGARIENLMINIGHKLQSDICGVLNIDILGSGIQIRLAVSSIDGKISLEVKQILCCTCPLCGQKVEAEIYNGMIHCPSCHQSRPWRNRN